MTRRFGWLLALSLGAATLAASSTAEAKGKQRRWGGFGHGFAGLVAGDLGGLDSSLSDEAALGPGAGSIAFGSMLGGGGRTLFGRRLLVGGKGYGLFSPPKHGIHGRAQILGGGGGLDVGVALYNYDNWLVYPYVGAQGFGMGLEVANDSTQERRIGEVTINPGASRGFSTGFAMIELGAGAQRLLFGDNDGGFIVGLELGFLYAIARSSWQVDEVDVIGPGAPALNGGYLRLTLGGGGFYSGPRKSRR